MDIQPPIQSSQSQSSSNMPSRWSRALTILIALAVGIAAGIFIATSKHTKPSASDAHSAVATAPTPKQLWTCGMHPQVIQDHPGNCPICGMALEPVATRDSDATAAIKIDPVIVQNMGVRVASVTQGPLDRTIRAVGYLNDAQPSIHDVNPRISGWIEKLYADTEGMHIRKGDPLFDLYSPELQVAIQELITARRTVETLPPDTPAVSRDTAQSLLDTTRTKLQLLGLTVAQIDEFSKLDHAPHAIPFLSPATGDLEDKMIVQGASIKSGDRVFRIVDRSTLWLDAQIFSQDLPFIKLAQPVTATLETLPGQSFAGQIIFIHPRLDPMTRTATARIAVPNSDLTLRPGMYASVQIQARLLDSAMLIPREAVLDTGTRQIVFVAGENGHFQPRHVTIGSTTDDGLVQILTGLSATDTIVTSGQFLMDAESRMREAIQKHLSDHLATTPQGHRHD